MLANNSAQLVCFQHNVIMAKYSQKQLSYLRCVLDCVMVLQPQDAHESGTFFPFQSSQGKFPGSAQVTSKYDLAANAAFTYICLRFYDPCLKG